MDSEIDAGGLSLTYRSSGSGDREGLPDCDLTQFGCFRDRNLIRCDLYLRSYFFKIAKIR
ncbi:hypothetical protein CKA32_004849 [Geitlerinema sp. FC II]|nr:hypothetical protein CKA32_004849 [Geitlerinema sp. FC II]